MIIEGDNVEEQAFLPSITMSNARTSASRKVVLCNIATVLSSGVLKLPFWLGKRRPEVNLELNDA